MLESIVIIAASTCSQPDALTNTTTDQPEVIVYFETRQIDATPERLP